MWIRFQNLESIHPNLVVVKGFMFLDVSKPVNDSYLLVTKSFSWMKHLLISLQDITFYLLKIFRLKIAKIHIYRYLYREWVCVCERERVIFTGKIHTQNRNLQATVTCQKSSTVIQNKRRNPWKEINLLNTKLVTNKFHKARK